MNLTAILAVLLGPVGFAIGWAFGYGKGREVYAGLVAEQGERLAGLAAEIDVLEQEIMVLVSPTPDTTTAARVLDIVSGKEPASGEA